MLVGPFVDTSSVMMRDAAADALLDENLHIVERAVLGMDTGVLGDVIAVVEPRRRVERQQPDSC